MALDATRLGTAMAAAMLANPATGAQAGPALNAMCAAIAASVIAEFQANGLCVPGITLLSATPGAPCTGAGKIL